MILVLLNFTACNDSTTTPSPANSHSKLEDGLKSGDNLEDAFDMEANHESKQKDNLASTLTPSNGLTIEGEKVNVRSKPSTSGKVVQQVNEGESYEKEGMSNFFETIGKQTDFWYQLDLGNGKNGWVFGAFTNLKLSANPRTDRLKFEDVAMGDYYHLSFSWPGGPGFGWKCPQYYMEPEGFCDFGYGGPHELSGYELEFEVEGSEYMELAPNPNYHQKMFDVTWKVLLGAAVEGEGSMETIEMETPQILSIKLVED